MVLDSVNEPSSCNNEDLSDLGTQLGNHLSLLENDGEDIYAPHRTRVLKFSLFVNKFGG
jgi:hypothetical protein